MNKGVKEVLKKVENELNDILYKEGCITAYAFAKVLFENGMGPDPITGNHLSDIAFCPEDRFDQMKMIYLGEEA